MTYMNDDINVNTDELSIFMLLFADDLVLISKTPDGLQALLDKLYNYCIEWQWNVSLNKTKIVVISKKYLNKIVYFYMELIL